MLERTVTSIESCKLPRILPPAPSQVQKSNHRLRTGFWQHGALAIELSRNWPAILEEQENEKKKEPRGSGPATKPIESELQSSAFRLDFLYPSIQTDKRQVRSNAKNDAKAGTPRCHTYVTSSEASMEAMKSDDRNARPTFGSPGTRLHFAQARDTIHNSVSYGNDTAKRPRHETHSLPGAMRAKQAHRVQKAPRGGSLTRNASGGTPEYCPESDAAEYLETTVEASITQSSGLVTDVVLNPPSDTGPTHSHELDQLLSLKDYAGNRHLDVYDAFARLKPEDRARYRPGVLVALSRSGNVVARNRTEALIRQINENEWTDEVLGAIVLHFMRKNERSVAVSYFKKGAMQLGLTGGLGPLLVDMFKTRFWSGALKIWETWYEAQSKQRRGEPSLDALKSISVLGKDLPGLYFSFEQYLASHRAHVLETHSLKSSNPAVAVFRRQFAEVALETCSPGRAEVLLDFYRTPSLYNRFLEAMAEKWTRKQINRETAWGLRTIYERYRQQENFAPSEAVLRGMFEIYYPDALQELDMLHDDWCRFQGELSMWAFNRYLKLHAKLGNIAATRDLLERQYKAHPQMDKDKGALRLMAVYARQGDVKAVRSIVQSLSTDSAKHFDHAIHHKLLSALICAGRYCEAISCFNAMDERGVLEASDYAEIMNMVSRNGDLKGTLDYLARAQDNNVQVSPKMVLSVTMALIGNDRLRDAEVVAAEMADLGISSTEIWNALIKANGLIGNMPRCYGIVAAMKQRKIDLLPSTYDEILLAMVRYGQVTAANMLLRDAEKHRTFPLADQHYAIVMAGAVRVGDFGTVAGLAKRMKALPHRPSFRAQVSLLSAAIRNGSTTQNTNAVIADVVASLQELQELKTGTVDSRPIGHALPWITDPVRASAVEPSPQKQHRSKLVDVSPSGLRQATAKIGHAVALMTELRDMFTVEELISKYVELHHLKSGELLPPSLMGSLLRAYYQDGEYRKAIEAWQGYWIQILDKWIDPKTGTARPNKQYALLHLFDTVTKCLRELQDGEQLSLFVSRVYAAGFKMSSNNWNIVVKTLAELGYFEPAMQWCEIMLMPYWRGWQRFPDTKDHHTRQTSKFIRAINRARLDYHFVRPHQETLAVLRDKQQEILQLSSWSSDKMALLIKVREQNPRTCHALMRAPVGIERNEGSWGFGRGKSYEDRLDSFVGNLSYEEAEQMMESLRHFVSSDILDNPKLLSKLSNEALASKIPELTEAKKSELMEALKEPLAGKDETADEGPVSATEPLTEQDVAALHKKVQEMIQVEKERGDAILALHMERWRTRTWKRNKVTRWDAHFVGWGDKSYVPDDPEGNEP